jgi:hypothetical protein
VGAEEGLGHQEDQEPGHVCGAAQLSGEGVSKMPFLPVLRRCLRQVLLPALRQGLAGLDSGDEGPLPEAPAVENMPVLWILPLLVHQRCLPLSALHD